MDHSKIRLVVCFAATFAALPARAAIEGLVVTPRGNPIEGARVEEVSSGAVRTTDSRGRFAFADAAPPATLRITHARFATALVEAAVPPPGVEAAVGTYALEPKREVYEEILVTARREPATGLEAVSVAASSLAPDEVATPPSLVVDLITAAPGVAENGQGGRFQAYSIRGVAGQRVLTAVAGVRIVTERRAGPTASFIDPLLLANAEVVRGPASTYYGSGALGGVVNLFPRQFAGTTVEVGYSAQGDESFARLGWGDEKWSLGLAARRADDGETPDGEVLFNRFEHYSAVLTRRWSLASGARVELLALPTVGRDIGKPNSRYPSRTTIYPEENHLVFKLGYTRPGGWGLELFAHPNELVTEDRQAGERSRVDNQAFDFGLNAQREVAGGGGWTALFGVEAFGRDGVRATEEDVNLESGARGTLRTLDGRQGELSVYASARRPVGRATVEAGGRLTRLQQANRGAATTEDTAWSGFAGLTLPLARGFEVVGNVGTGLRFPGLSERFLTGATGRGEVVANQDLEPERSLSADLGLRYFGSRFFVAAYGFRNSIDDYVERVEIAPGVRGFANLTAGTLEGLEVEGFASLAGNVELRWRGQHVDGRADDGSPLADVPSDRVALSLRLASPERPWEAAVSLEHRFAENDPGPGEQPTPAAAVLSASLGYRLGEGLTVRVFGANLLDETYLPSADDLAVPAPGRSLGVGMSWGVR